jgi:hypothetical protein
MTNFTRAISLLNAEIWFPEAGTSFFICQSKASGTLTLLSGRLYSLLFKYSGSVYYIKDKCPSLTQILSYEYLIL